MIKPGKYPAIHGGTSANVDTALTVEALIEQLQKLPPKAQVYVVSVYGHVQPRAHLDESGCVGLLPVITISLPKEPEPAAREPTSQREERKQAVMTDTNRTELIKFLDRRCVDLNNTLNDFKKGIGTEDWALSMERSHYAFEAAARHSVFTRVCNALTAKDSKATIETLRTDITREIRRLARPRHSSSPTSNLIHGETLAAWVEVLEMLETRS